MIYDIQLSREVYDYQDAKTGKPSKCRIVTAIRRSDGQRKRFKVDLKILDNDNHWKRFLDVAVKPWVAGVEEITFK